MLSSQRHHMTQSLFLRSKMSELCGMQTQSAPLLLQALQGSHIAPGVKEELLQRTQEPPALQSQISPCYPSLSEDQCHWPYFSFLTSHVLLHHKGVSLAGTLCAPFPAWLALPHSPSLHLTVTSSRKTPLPQKRLNLPVLHFHCAM